MARGQKLVIFLVFAAFALFHVSARRKTHTSVVFVYIVPMCSHARYPRNPTQGIVTGGAERT